MDKVAGLNAGERNDLFREAAAILGISPAIVEKDFWVCWVLKQIFRNRKLKNHFVFKGGTSLSKVYRVIERFSEDVDLILDWGLLGYGKEEDPYRDFSSGTQQDRFARSLNRRAAEYIRATLHPQLAELLSSCPGVSAEIDSKDPLVLKIPYPAAFPEDYLRPEISLEIGPLASFVPRNKYTIGPYAAEALPGFFTTPGFRVVATSIERTFWEKATLLHQQAHRPGPMPPRYSRHYYDMHKLAESEFRERSINDLSLLTDVVRFKIRFYRSAWARYEEAKPGSFKLVPKEEHLASLRRDYNEMKVMIFGGIPAFDLIIESLVTLEKEINGLK